jgi:hypothetical protein
MTNTALAIRDDMPLMDLGKVLAGSGFFADTRDAGQAIVKVLAGRELGLPAIAAMTGIYIVKGRVSLSANLMASLVKRSGKYNYRVKEHTAEACEIAFSEKMESGWEEVGTSRFTAADARKAGTQNMDKYAKNMLFARAMSNGVKWFCPDVTGGPVYTPEEMGEKVDGEGDVIEMVAKPEPPKPQPSTNGHKVDAVSVAEVALDDMADDVLRTMTKPARPFAADVIKAKIAAGAKKNSGKAASPNQRILLIATLEDCYPGTQADEARHLALKYLTGEASSKNVPDAYVLALLDWLKPAQDTTGAWAPDAMAEREAALVLRQARIEAGQPELLPA